MDLRPHTPSLRHALTLCPPSPGEVRSPRGAEARAGHLHAGRTHLYHGLYQDEPTGAGAVGPGNEAAWSDAPGNSASQTQIHSSPKYDAEFPRVLCPCAVQCLGVRLGWVGGGTHRAVQVSRNGVWACRGGGVCVLGVSPSLWCAVLNGVADGGGGPALTPSCIPVEKLRGAHRTAGDGHQQWGPTALLRRRLQHCVPLWKGDPRFPTPYCIPLPWGEVRGLTALPVSAGGQQHPLL